MKLVFVCNDCMTEKSDYMTVRLAWTAANRGHDVAYVGMRELTYTTEERIVGPARIPRQASYEGDEAFLKDIQGEDARIEPVDLGASDIVLLRADPAGELSDRPWSHPTMLLMAQMAAEQGALVLNDPFRLTNAVNKLYFQNFPAEMRPKTLITRDDKKIRSFIDDEGGQAVIKPLQGSGGAGVFVIDDSCHGNIGVIIETTLETGPAIVQEYLPEASKGDLRIITLDGEPLKVDGTYCALRRQSAGPDARSNFSAGGTIELEEPDERALHVARLCAEKLKADGMYIAGLDVVGDKMMEINVDTAGGVNFADDQSGIDFSAAIVADLEAKAAERR